MTIPPSEYGEKEINMLRGDSVELLSKAMNEMEITAIGQLSPWRVKQMNKDTVCDLLHKALRYLEEFTGVVSTDYKMASNSVKHQMFETQETIIKLQSELLACKNEQLESLQTSVKSSVGESVKAEFQSYSSVLQANCPESQKPVSSEMIKKAVKTVVQEEDRNKNLMIFGLSEQDNEELSTVVSEVFSAIGEKPRIEASRVGKLKPGKAVRPVKVTAASATIVNQILAKSRNLRATEKFKTVFISPDRSPEQRAKQRELVRDMKRLVTEQPDKLHFIRNGAIKSTDKTNKTAE